MPAIPLKYLIGGGLAIALTVAAWFLIRDIKHDAYEAGRADMAKDYRDKVAENERLNRQLENALIDKATAVQQAVEKTISAMVTKSNDTTIRIQRELDARPELEKCQLPKEILDMRNEARVRP